MEPTMIEGKPYLSMKQLAKQKEVAHTTVHRWIQEKRFPNAKKIPVGGIEIWMIPLSDIEQATYPRRGSPSLVKAGKVGKTFIGTMRKKIGAAATDEVLTVGFKGMKKSTAKGHIRTAARLVNRTIRFTASPDDVVTFRILPERGKDESEPSPTRKGTDSGVDHDATVDGTNASSAGREARGESAVDAAPVDDRAVLSPA